MGLKPGHTNNLNGRKKGVPNKVTTNLKVWINDFLHNNKDRIQKDFESVEPAHRLNFYEKLLKYSVPVMQATSITEQLNDNQVDKILNDLKKTVENEINRKA